MHKPVAAPKPAPGQKPTPSRKAPPSNAAKIKPPPIALPTPIAHTQPSPAPFGWQIMANGLWRWPTLFTWEISSGISWRSIFFQASYQIPTDWTWDERVFQVSAISLRTGWQHYLWCKGDWRTKILIGLIAEKLTLQRTDYPTTELHSFWDVGAHAGLLLNYKLIESWRLGALLDSQVNFTGRQLEISAGPSRSFNLIGIRAGLVLSWEP